MSVVNDTKVSEQINYHKLQSSHPVYQYRNIYPANGGSRTVTLTSGGAVQNTIFNIPAECINMGESYLEYLLTVPAQGAGNFGWIFHDTCGEYSDVLYRDTGSQNIVELRYANIYQHVMNRINYSKQELEYNDSLQGLVLTNAP